MSTTEKDCLWDELLTTKCENCKLSTTRQFPFFTGNLLLTIFVFILVVDNSSHRGSLSVVDDIWFSIINGCQQLNFLVCRGPVTFMFSINLSAITSLTYIYSMWYINGSLTKTTLFFFQSYSLARKRITCTTYTSKMCCKFLVIIKHWHNYRREPNNFSKWWKEARPNSGLQRESKSCMTSTRPHFWVKSFFLGFILNRTFSRSIFSNRSNSSQLVTLHFGSRSMPVLCHFGDFGCGDGGWTLVMKIDGNKVLCISY